MLTNEAFLRSVFRGEWQSAHITSFMEDPNDPNLDRKKWMGGHARERLAWAIPVRNNYFTVSLFAADEKGVARRRKALFRQMPLVVVDDVDGVKVTIERATALLGDPSYALMTSHGNMQFGYLFESPITDRHAAEALVDEMIKRGLTTDGVDPGMRGVTRYVRLPVGRNTKAKYGPQGYTTHMVEWNPDQKHSAEGMAKRLGFSLFAEAAARRRAEEVMQSGLKGERGSDALLAALEVLDLVKTNVRSKADAVEITCPFLEDHTGNADTGTAYMRGGGGIACHHGHCRTRTRGDYVKRICADLDKLGTPEAEAAIYNLTAHAELRRELRVTARKLIKDHYMPDAITNRLKEVVKNNGVATDVSRVEIEEAMKWAYEDARAERNREAAAVITKTLYYNMKTGKMEERL
jgi:hypothetical protein